MPDYSGIRVRSALLGALGALALGGTSALGATVTVNGTVTNGGLSTTFPPSTMQLPTSNLDDGGDPVVYLDLPFVVEDNRGNGSGWSLSVTSNGFWRSLAPMPGTAASFIGATTSCVAETLCTLPATTTSYPVPLPASAPAVRFFNADTGSGMGQSNVSARMAVKVPGNSLVGNFATTLTLSQSAGP